MSPRGAVGRFQILPGTARPYLPEGLSDEQITAQLRNPRINAEVGLRLIRDIQAKYPDRPDLAMAEYFGGPGAVQNGAIARPQVSDGNLTRQQYVDRGMARLQSSQQRFAGPGAIAPPAEITPPVAAPSAPASPVTPTQASPVATAPAQRPLTTRQQEIVGLLEGAGYQHAELFARDPGVLAVFNSRRPSMQQLGEALNTAETRMNLQAQREHTLQLRKDSLQLRKDAENKHLEETRTQATGKVQEFFNQGAITSQQRTEALTALGQATDPTTISHVLTGLQIAPVLAQRNAESDRLARERVQLTRDAQVESKRVHEVTQAQRVEDQKTKQDERTRKTLEDARGEIRTLALEKVKLLKADKPSDLLLFASAMAPKGNAATQALAQQLQNTVHGGADFEASKQQTLELLGHLQRFYIDQLPAAEQQTMHEIVGTPLVPATAPVTRTK